MVAKDYGPEEEIITELQVTSVVSHSHDGYNATTTTITTMELLNPTQIEAVLKMLGVEYTVDPVQVMHEANM